jgi:restriction system protein
MEQLKVQYREEYTRSYDKRYIAEITHNGLNFFRIIKADDSNILQNKVNACASYLDERWDRVVHKQIVVRDKYSGMQESEKRTKDAIKALEDIDNVLIHTLSIDDTVNWDDLKDKSRFTKPNPSKSLDNKLQKIELPTRGTYTIAPFQPQKSQFSVKLSFIDKIFKSQGNNKLQQSEEEYQEAMTYWNSECERINKLNHSIDEEYTNALLQFEKGRSKVGQEVERDVKNWEKEQIAFYEKQEKGNAKVEELKRKYFDIDAESVVEYCDLVLNNSQYPESFPKSFDLDYNLSNKILIVEYTLPTYDDIPNLNEVKYISGKNELKEYFISETQKTKLYDACLYKITLRTIHELFEADKANAISAVSFNGWVNAVNRATGKRENNCILSIQAKKEEFNEIDLAHVDPKICFKNFKGIGSSKLSGMTPIQPILQINRTDKRFTNAYEVVHGVSEATNLAAMDWQDFEHLIREIFAKEFSGNGGEVKVTQASKDGGVDAIAFDPDPIRGGKIVIQAKRYTNTVGVSAVRDLYGTVMNEGATKGILVTTADYGPDAYDFVKGKPLTLMNGANLLYLLEKHGHKAKIDIKEAKKMLK